MAAVPQAATKGGKKITILLAGQLTKTVTSGACSSSSRSSCSTCCSCCSLLTLLHISLSLSLAPPCPSQSGQRACAAAWWSPVTRACRGWPTCPSRPRTCGRSPASHCSSSSGWATASSGRSGWVRVPGGEGRKRGGVGGGREEPIRERAEGKLDLALA